MRPAYGRSVPRPASLLLPVALALALVPTSAEAAIRHTTPTAGSAASCSAAAPCSLRKAIESASAFDEVVLAPGTYTESAEILGSAAGLEIHGQPGQPAPTLVTHPQQNSDGIRLPGGLSHVHHLRFEAAGATALSVQTGSTVEDVSVTSGAGSQGITVFGNGSLRTTIRDVLIEAPGLALTLWNANVDVRNATLLSPHGIRVFTSVTGRDVTVRNTLISTGFSGQTEAISLDGTAATTVDVDYSRAVSHGGSNAAGSYLAGSHNINALPLYAAVSGRPAAGSPTIDAGRADSLTTAVDPDGTVRPLGAAIDIGAFEFRTPQVVFTGGATAVTRDGANLNGTIDAQGGTASWRFVYGPTTAYGAAGPSSPYTAGPGPHGVTGAIGAAGGQPALLPGTSYHFRLEATDAYGTVVAGEDHRFTTAPAPDVPGPTPAATVDEGAGGTPPATGASTTTTTPSRPRSAAVVCRVPSLRGKRLGQARTALRRAHCALGRVRHRGARRPVVRTQTVRAGQRRASGTRIGVTLAPRGRPRRG